MRRATLAAVVAAMLWPSSAQAQRACVEGVTVYDGTFNRDFIEILAQNSVTCVHVRVRQDQWMGLDDPMRRGDPPRTMFEVWDDLINLYRARGIDVTMAFGADAIGRATHELRDPARRTQYASFVARMVARYAHQVKRFELVDYGDRPPPPGVTGVNALPPADIAMLVLETRRAIRVMSIGQCRVNQQVALNGGSDDSVAAGGVNYLRAIYAAGLGEDGAEGLWASYRASEDGRLPFDAIAMHALRPFDVRLGSEGQGEGAVSSAAEAAGNVLVRFEGSRNARAVWITAGGLPSDGSGAQNVRQRDWVSGFFSAVLRSDVSTPIEMASWYAFVDPPWDRGNWGFYNDGDLRRSNERTPGRLAFTSAMARYRPQPNALLRWNDPPLRLRPGEVRRVHLRVTNYGPNGDRGTWHPTDRLRVGAGPSCPDTEEVNQVRWTGFPSGGSAGAAAVDGRVEVPILRDWWSEVPRTVEWDVTAPTAPGTYRLVARLIWGDSLWFGQNAISMVEVVAPPLDASLDASTDASADGGGDGAADVSADVAERSFDAGLDALGDGATGDGATGDGATGDGATGDGATGDGAAAAGGIDGSAVDVAMVEDLPLPTDQAASSDGGGAGGGVDVGASRSAAAVQCGCAVSGSRREGWWWLAGLGVLSLQRRRRRDALAIRHP